MEGLFTAGAVGLIFAKNATISGTRAAVAKRKRALPRSMTAAALVEISGGARRFKRWMPRRWR